MKKSNKVLSLVIALIFMFSAVTPAFAISDEAPDAAATLVGLGVIEGYEDGSLGLDQTITRAEMCVVLAEMADMSSAAAILADIPSSFNDVKTGVWYTGYINLAAQQGWVSGYPDGSFKPNAPVSYAEAITMMLNVLGYGDGELPGTWPLNYIVKATNIDLTDDVTFSANAAALRGDVFVMAKAALDAKQVNWDKDEESFVTDTEAGTLLAALTSGDTGEVQVVDAYMMVGSTLEDDDREVTTRVYDSVDGYVYMDYEVAEGFDIRPFVGIPTTFYLNSDDEIIAVEDTEDVDVDDVVEFDMDGDVLLDDSDDTEYDVANDAVIVVNDEVVLAGESTHVYLPASINYVLDSEDYVIYAEFIDYTDMDYALVEDVDVDDYDVDFDFYAGDSEFKLDLEDDNETAMVMGDADDLADIEEYDVLYWNESSDDFAFYVVRDTESGEADRYVDGKTGYVRVDGTKYDADNTTVFASSDEGESFDPISTFKDYSEEDVTLFLDGYGDVYAISGDVSETADEVAVAVAEIEYNENWEDYTYRIDLFLASGEEATYYFDADFVTDDLKWANPGDIASDGFDSLTATLVSYSLDDDGELDFFEKYDDSSLIGTFNALDDADTVDYGRVYANGGDAGNYYNVSDSVFFNVYELVDADSTTNDVILLSWDDIEDMGDATGIAGVVYGESDKDIDYMLIQDEADTQAFDYALFVDQWEVGSDDFVSYFDADGLHEEEYDGTAPTFDDNIIVEVEIGINLTEVSGPGLITDSLLDEDAYNSTRSTVYLDGDDYDVDSSTIVIDNSGSDPVLIDLADLDEENFVQAYSEDGMYLDIIVVQDSADFPK
jgi:hypothetical protein